MKLLTINTHSLVEENYEKKLKTFVDVIIEEKPDIIAMQEVNQSIEAQSINKIEVKGYIECQQEISIKKDNHGLMVAKHLYDAGLEYEWTWLPLKLGYGKYDEGLAIFSRKKIGEIDSFLVSEINDYANWKTRKVLGIKADEQWFYTVHLGWWNDEEEAFEKQWERLSKHLKSKEKIFLLGDFNSRADVRNEGYDCVIASGWRDTYILADKKDEGFTVAQPIDGWRENMDNIQKMRIDYIFCNYEINVKDSYVIFNGINKKVISDHYGIMINVD